MSRIFFTSDLHFYHSNVIGYCNRPYESVEEMNEALITNWNSVVGPDDTVYCLGDLSLAIRPIELFSHRLNGKKFLVPGNHDWCHPAHPKSKTPAKLLAMQEKYQHHGWYVLPIHHFIHLDGTTTVKLCHLPYKGDSTDERYHKYRLDDEGEWLLHGHSHSSKDTYQKGRMIDVGVDAHNYTPVSLDKILEIIRSKKS